jgi:orotate phosphoribosyltransferase
MIPYPDIPSLDDASARRRLLEILTELSFRYSKEGFTLASGRKSPYYIDCKPAFSSAEARRLIGYLIFKRNQHLALQGVGGMAVGAIPIANAVSDEAFRVGREIRSFFVRKNAKDHGTQRKVEGNIRPGEKVLMVEDVVTTGQSTIEAIETARGFGLKVLKVVALIDREESDGRKRIEDLDLPFDSLFTLRDFEPGREKASP